MDPKPVKREKPKKTLGRGSSSRGPGRAGAADAEDEPFTQSAYGHAKPPPRVKGTSSFGRPKPGSTFGKPKAGSSFGKAKPGSSFGSPKRARAADDEGAAPGGIGHAKPVRQPRPVDEDAEREAREAKAEAQRERKAQRAAERSAKPRPEPDFPKSWADLPPPPDVPLLSDVVLPGLVEVAAAVEPEVELTGQAAMDAERAEFPVLAPRVKRERKKKVAELAFSESTPHQRAIDLAYVLVSQRERTVGQLREKLAKKECTPAGIEAAVEELVRCGFVDDRRYARLYAEDKRRLQGWGALRIRLALGKAGISRDILDALFADDEAELDAPSELEAALDLLVRRGVDSTDPKARQRAAGMLARRGIASPTVYAALRQHAAQEAADA